MKKVFITGTNSFIGQELIKQCDELSIEVHGVDLVKSSHPNCHVADINDPSIEKYIPDEVDAVIHLAALSRDPDCNNKGLKTISVNVNGTHNVMDAAEQKSVKQFIFASTEWVYTSFEDGVSRKEDDFIDIQKINSEYALSKLVSENNLRQKYNRGFCDTTILRFGIVYGPRDENLSAVESLMIKVAREEEIKVGSLKTGRCFIHVRDLAKGILSSLGLKGFNTLNIQGQQLITLDEILKHSAKLLGKNIDPVETSSEHPSIRRVSSSKALELLGWEAKITIEQGLDELTRYFGYKLKGHS